MEQGGNFEDPSLENIQQPVGYFVDESQDILNVVETEKSPSSFPSIDTNTQRIVFPDEEEERFFPTYPQTSLPSSTNQVFSSPSKSSPLEIIPSNPTTVKPIQPNPTPDLVTRPSPTPVQNAASQPFITCPSAMKCVEKINCNFNGVMVEEPVFLNPEQEAQRVPLIVS